MVDAQDKRLRNIKDNTLLLITYETIRRRANYVWFEFEDLPGPMSGKPALRLRFSKTNRCNEKQLK